MADRCTGQCCTDIALHVPPEEMERSYKAWMSRENNDRGSVLSISKDEWIERTYNEIHLIYPMLTFLRKNKTHPDGGVKGKGDPGRDRRTMYHYSCKHFDAKKKKCTIYENRPEMCRTHGLGVRGCGYTGCQWKEATDNYKRYCKVKAEQSKEGSLIEKVESIDKKSKRKAKKK